MLDGGGGRDASRRFRSSRRDVKAVRAGATPEAADSERARPQPKTGALTTGACGKAGRRGGRTVDGVSFRAASADGGGAAKSTRLRCQSQDADMIGRGTAAKRKGGKREEHT